MEVLYERLLLWSGMLFESSLQKVVAFRMYFVI